MRDIFIYTHNARVFYRLTKVLREEEIPWNAIDTFYDVHSLNSVIVTTNEDFEKYNPKLDPEIFILHVSESYTDEQLLLKTLQFQRGVNSVRSLTVALDPGSEVTGAAIFLNKVLIYSRDFYSLPEVIRYIKKIFKIYPQPQKIIKIGAGHKRLTKKFLKELKENFLNNKKIHYELINEAKTSQNRIKHKKHSKHEYAAIEIGRRKRIGIV